MAQMPPPSQYAPGAVAPLVDEWSDQPDYVVVEGAGLTDADREALYRVVDALSRYEPIHASGSLLRLTLREGTVVLAGRVRSAPLKIMAERLAASAAPGGRFRSEVISDADVTIAVVSALAQDARTNLVPVFVETGLGQVTLGGNVPSAAMAAAAEEIARGLPGVARVRNQLVVKAPPAPPAPPTPAEAKVEAGATTQPVADTAFTSEPRLEPHSRDQDANRVTRPAPGGEQVPVADT
jgi:osmotically-inducible protein OsmY